MISVASLKKNIYQTFALLVGTGLPLEIIYKGKVYQVYIRPTDIKPVYNRPKRPLARKAQINTYKLNYGDCRECGYLTVNDNCLNWECPTLHTDPKRLFNEKRYRNLQRVSRNEPKYALSPLMDTNEPTQPQ